VKRLIQTSFALLLAAGCGAPPPEAAPSPAEAVAVLDPSAPLADALAALDDRPLATLAEGPELRWTGPAAAVARLVDAGLARFGEPLVEYGSDFVPSDPSLKEQWALADIDAPRAWDAVPSARRAVVAVIDSGVRLEHPDLADALWTNEGEVPGNGLDDDDNGYVDDVAGWDFVDDDADPSPEGAGDAANHGTHVAGIVAATSGNKVGIAGVAPGALVMPIRAMQGGAGRSDWVADGIDYAVRNGARVVNLSLGGAYSRLVDDAIARAWREGVAVVAAAGNQGGSVATFPAASRSPGVLGVAATNPSRRLASFSNVGAGVDLGAPGVDILSTFGASGYRGMSGTSMAAPHVAGALALRLAGRGRAGHGSLEAMLDGLPLGPDGLPRLDLPAMVEPSSSPRGPAAPIGLKRTRLAFHSTGNGRKPPPQTIALAAAASTPFRVEAPAWVKPGRCRRAPCKLSLTVDPAGLQPGAHSGSVVLRPESGAASELVVELHVGLGAQPLAIEATYGEASVRGPGVVRLSRGAPVRLKLVREGRRAAARWWVDDVAYAGHALLGAFPRPGSYIVRAVSESGEEAVLPVLVAEGAAGAATGLGVPDGR
jgi:hypothetical protein